MRELARRDATYETTENVKMATMIVFPRALKSSNPVSGSLVAFAPTVLAVDVAEEVAVSVDVELVFAASELASEEVAVFTGCVVTCD